MANYFDEMGIDQEEPSGQTFNLERVMADFGLHYEDIEIFFMRPPPAQQSFIDSLEEVTVTSKDALCTICIKEYLENETAKKLPCEHTFHSECILRWLKKTSSCPLCRCEFPTGNEKYEQFLKLRNREVRRRQDLEVLHHTMFT